MDTKKQSLDERQKVANYLLELLSEHTDYRHGANNPYRKWLETNPKLAVEKVVDFLKFWYPVSRHQPQILLQCMAGFPSWEDRKSVLPNWFEEDGMGDGQDPHYFLLQELIHKLDPEFRKDHKLVRGDGSIRFDDEYTGDSEANAIVSKFHDTLYRKLTPGELSGLIAAIEHPALDISAYFNKIVALCGREDLLKTDLYLMIHIDVEPDHIIASHSKAEEYIKRGRADEVLSIFEDATEFWCNFWNLAFQKLGYPCDVTSGTKPPIA